MDESDVYVREEGDRPIEHSPRGRYIRFDIRLGTGAYKSVYKAYDTDQGIDVAWNAIDIGLLPSTEKTRIIQEVQLLQKLEHKNIINFYGSWFSKEKNQVVFITEIMTSGTLKSYIKRVQFIKWKIIKRWCIQILEGLHYLHSQNPPVIHRDLKCDNIFVNGNTGDLRIGDLGLSTQLAVDKRSKAQSVLGTPEFMAPELYDESYDEKVDIYAFGMCVLEMVTKEVPYSECINPAQIYKKVTAGIRPKGLQRVVSQAARDFIELCLSRGNGLVDVTAQYLLDHPFLKAQDDDNDMVECLDEDELERESKQAQQRLERVAEESFSLEFNMEGGSKEGTAVVVSERHKQFASLSAKPEVLLAASTVSGSAFISKYAGSASMLSPSAPEEKKTTAGTHRLTELPPVGSLERNNTTALSSTEHAPSLTSASMLALTPTLAPTSSIRAIGPSPEEFSKFVHSPSQPVISEIFGGDEPLLSGKKSADSHVDQFLATLPGTESAIQNTRINIMGGRGHRLDLENDSIPEYADSPAESPLANGKETPEHSQSLIGESPFLRANNAKIEPPNSAPGLLTPSQAPEGEIPSLRLPERDIEPQANLVRRASIHGQFGALLAASRTAENVAPAGSLSTPLPPSQQSFQSAASSGATRKRPKRHEIKAAKDPNNEHSILLNLRIIIDGKSKEIKFPFNLFADSPHEVACELAVDVGILEPDLEDIADSIRFLVTEGKINNLSDVQEDVWEEAPEPHSFSSIPFPNVSKMSFVHMPPETTYQQQQAFLMNATPLERTSSGASAVTSGVSTSLIGAGGSAATMPGPKATQEVEVAGSLDSVSAASLSDPSTTLMVVDGGIPSGGSSSSSGASLPFPNEVSRSPPQPGHGHAASKSNLTKEALLSILEMRARGMSMGSVADATYVQQIHQLEDRLKIARTSFDERESSLEAAIRSEEEKHQREIERFRKKMEEFDKQRAAILRQQNGDSVANGSSSTALDESLRLVGQEDLLATANAPNLSTDVDFNSDVGFSLSGSDDEAFPTSPAATAAAPLPISVSSSAPPHVNPSVEAAALPAAVPVDELIPDRESHSAATSAARTDTTTSAAANSQSVSVPLQ
ncbi:unnamed protein product [Peronospora belbahrii]|uniref:Protein kinase domain-containing protein n=1 Tax=Peronospora belbahrii TaxID=622444 RepID=A0ABN8DAK3_9STRA|nr:unnamed protein product [Peronospora belbahrii]